MKLGIPVYYVKNHIFKASVSIQKVEIHGGQNLLAHGVRSMSAWRPKERLTIFIQTTIIRIINSKLFQSSR